MATPKSFVSRSAWGARPPRGITGSSMARGVAVHWEGPTMGWPWPHSQCAARVRGIQAFHMDSRGWADIAYNDLVCGHGYVFEGRGPDVRNAANGGNGNDNATHMAICYIGGEGDEFTAAARDAINDAAEHLGVAGGDWRPHRYFTETACPGDVIAAWVAAGHPRVTAPTPEEDDLTPEQAQQLAEVAAYVRSRAAAERDANRTNDDRFATLNGTLDDVKARVARIEAAVAGD